MVVKDVMNIGDVERVYAAAQTPQDQFLLTVIETLPMRLISLESLQWKDIIPGKGVVFQGKYGKRTLSIHAKFVRSLLVYYDEYTSINPGVDICNCYVMNLNNPTNPARGVCRHALVRLAREANVKNMSAHRFRLGVRHMARLSFAHVPQNEIVEQF